MNNINLTIPKFNGIILLNKPSGMTSQMLLKKLMRITKIKKIGHAGTLDPDATGLVIAGVGEGTKCMQLVENMPKTYRFDLVFGSTTTTGDASGEIVEQTDYIPNIDEVQSIFPKFIGNITQTPPKYSAIKINGHRAYDLARKNVDFIMKSREIEIHSIDLTDKSNDLQNLKEHSSGAVADSITKSTKSINLTVSCSKGTYIRALAEDIAKSLGSLGHAHNIHRKKIGKFSISDAFSLEEIEKIVYKDELANIILAPEALLDDILVVNLTQVEIQAFIYGQKIDMSHHDVSFLQKFEIDKRVPVMNDSKLYGFGTLRCDNDKIYLQALRVINVQKN